VQGEYLSLKQIGDLEVVGTGYGRFQMATDPRIHSTVAARDSVPAEFRQRIVADNENVPVPALRRAPCVEDSISL
jgi:hypothetical protein